MSGACLTHVCPADVISTLSARLCVQEPLWRRHQRRMLHQCNVGQSYPRIPALNMAPRAIDSPLCRLAGCAVSSLMQHGFRAKLTTVSIMRSTHLINAGKYSAGILYFFIYFNWRITSQSAYDFRFAMFIVFAVINSTYSLIWDLLMDWGLLRRKSKNFLLRDELAWRRTKWVRLALIPAEPR